MKPRWKQVRWEFFICSSLMILSYTLQDIHLTCNQLVLIQVGWPNSEKLVDLCTKSSSTKVNTSGWPKEMQVGVWAKNLHYLGVHLGRVLKFLFRYYRPKPLQFSSVSPLLIPFLLCPEGSCENFYFWIRNVSFWKLDQTMQRADLVQTWCIVTDQEME